MNEAGTAFDRACSAVAAEAGSHGRHYPDVYLADLVRAVLQAIREPDDRAMFAGDALAYPKEGYYPGAGPVWIAMIDAILSSQER